MRAENAALCSAWNFSPTLSISKQNFLHSTKNCKNNHEVFSIKNIKK